MCCRTLLLKEFLLFQFLWVQFGCNSFFVRLCAATDNFDLAAGTLFAIQFFGNFLILFLSLGCSMRIIKELVLKCFWVERKHLSCYSFNNHFSFFHWCNNNPFLFSISGLSLSFPTFILIVLLGMWFV